VSRGSFSVALATYNGQRFLPLQLASLAAQTVLPTELVVCDDSSTDGTVRALEEFRADAPFPMKIHTNSEQLGFAETFFRCAARCSGDWIAFCDQDDLWLEQKLERCERELERPGVLLVVHSSRLADDRLKPTRELYPHVRNDHLEGPLAGDPWQAVRGMSMAFNAELLRVADPRRRPRSHYAPGRMNHDEWVYVLARALGTTSYIAEPLALYRQHASNVTGAARTSERLPQLLSVGSAYYSARREQALELAGLFEEIAERDVGSRERAAAATVWYRRQAEALGRRLSVYDSGATRSQRLGRLFELARTETYGSRKRGGFGFRALARDAAMIALRRAG
jgi:rhamnosyltransferase